MPDLTIIVETAGEGDVGMTVPACPAVDYIEALDDRDAEARLLQVFCRFPGVRNAAPDLNSAELLAAFRAWLRGGGYDPKVTVSLPSGT